MNEKEFRRNNEKNESEKAWDFIDRLVDETKNTEREFLISKVINSLASIASQVASRGSYIEDKHVRWYCQISADVLGNKIKGEDVYTRYTQIRMHLPITPFVIQV